VSGDEPRFMTDGELRAMLPKGEKFERGTFAKRNACSVTGVVSDEDGAWLRAYCKRHGVTISSLIRRFIAVLREAEEPEDPITKAIRDEGVF
jgi:hypothetical protein